MPGPGAGAGQEGGVGLARARHRHAQLRGVEPEAREHLVTRPATI